MSWYRHRSLLWASLIFFGLLPRTKSAPLDIPSAASFWVPSIPDLHQDPEHPLKIFAGHVSSDPNASSAPATAITGHIYFVMVKARRTADKERIVFWFNGGPGCSSFDGLMMEVGPWRVDGNGGLKTVEGGWEEYTTMVYVDQPVGTGFSYAPTNGYVHGLSQASDQFIEFLKNWYQIFPEYANVDTYLAGESFAGQYIPYFASAILQSNLNTPLRGIAIGNGWIDPRNQYPAYLEFGLQHGLVEENSALYMKIKEHTDGCIAAMASALVEPVQTAMCEEIMPLVTSSRDRVVDGQRMCANVYDVRLDDTSPACGMNWPPDLPDIYKYLARGDVVRALHATAKSETWVECQGRVHSNMDDNRVPPSVVLLPGLLEQIDVLLFAGNQDIICNHVGIESIAANLEWGGQTGLGNAQIETWTVNDRLAGTWVSARNLTYVKMFNASHMAPFDVLLESQDMMNRFMGMDFSAIVNGSARIPSSVGDSVKPIFLEDDSSISTPGSGKTPVQDKAMWDAYYNAGSVALVLVLAMLAVGTCIWWRRRRQIRGLPISQNKEENIPLNSSVNGFDHEDQFRGNGKGKERAIDENTGTSIFDVGETSDDEEHFKDRRD